MKKAKSHPAILIGKGLPEFENISPKDIEKYIPILLKNLNIDLNHLEIKFIEFINTNKPLSWDEIITPISEIEEKLRWSWGAVCHLNGVCNSTELRKAYSSQQPSIVRFNNRLGQSEAIFKVLSKLSLSQSSQSSLNKTQQRIINSELLSMKHRGVGLIGRDKETFNSNSERLAELSTVFSNNVLDATKKWTLLLTKPDEIDGLPKRSLEAMSKAAKEAAKSTGDSIESNPDKGPWLLGLDIPTYISFMTYSNNRSLRETLYKAFISRASSGEISNNNIIEQILILRKQQAQLLGYNNWAEVSLANKMAKNVTEVEKLLEELRKAAMPTAKMELNRLQSFAAKNTADNDFQLSPWDISFWSEKLRKKIYNLDQESLRPWFPLPQVLDGLFKLCERLFEITISPQTDSYPTWNKDVKLFNVLDKDNCHIASFYLDPYIRPASKRGGAWMDECLIKQRLKNGDLVLPVAYLICNQTPPVGASPSLMSFEEVKTLFHEFGHGLQHMLTTVEYPKAAGINNVEWDAVELPSQFMENWCLDKKTIKNIARHWETKAPLPDNELEKLRKNQTFNTGLATLRQIHFALTDIKLHSEWDKSIGTKPDELRRDIAKTTTVMEPIPEDNLLCSFSHIFAGGYSAGYYSYKWAEVLSSDAYSMFEEAGLDNEEEVQAIGKKFRDTILSLGGSRSPEEIYKDFRGRSSSTEALIRHCGLTGSANK
ncbi:M3 family metallopeptidase [Prochlorococcus marinus]|uniref:M3 family metallopeptidase n=1 Tax=Prochlorococcus marinus TaxID=1219 RepID=UPI0022B38E64|nr:M3 family metallopeptidase [Prochlorococcus marinus]